MGLISVAAKFLSSEKYSLVLPTFVYAVIIIFKKALKTLGALQNLM